MAHDIDLPSVPLYKCAKCEIVLFHFTDITDHILLKSASLWFRLLPKFVENSFDEDFYYIDFSPLTCEKEKRLVDEMLKGTGINAYAYIKCRSCGEKIGYASDNIEMTFVALKRVIAEIPADLESCSLFSEYMWRLKTIQEKRLFDGMIETINREIDKYKAKTIQNPEEARNENYH